jgi:hypothetical protein
MYKKYFTEEERRLAKNKRQKIYDKIHKEEKKLKAKKHYQKYKEDKQTYQKNNKEKIKITKQRYYKDNKETIKNKVKEYNSNHKDTRNKYIRSKLKTDLNFKLSHGLRSRLWRAIKNGSKSGSAVHDLGCSIPELKIYLESKFQKGMTWDNWTWNGWHIDHIIPLDFFNLQNKEEFLKACHYTNLQPMWAEENWIKGNKQNNK